MINSTMTNNINTAISNINRLS